MSLEALPAGGMALFFVLGLRHGMEPDHIAAIDGMTLRALDRHERHAAWTGTLFALGHGLAIAVLALGVSLVAASFTLPATLVAFTDWLPVALLLGLGAWNLRALLVPGEYRPASLRMRLMPAGLRDRSDAWATVAIGLLFALVVDTLAHVSAWSVFATHRGGWWVGALAGLLFSAGMLVASTADSQLLCRVLRSADAASVSQRYRRGVGWFVVVLSFAVALYAAITLLGGPGSGVGEAALQWAVAASVIMLAALWWWRRRRAAVRADGAA
jgi:high-affinity nickel-transport protein